MEEALSMEQMPAEQDRRISETFERERPRLRRFIRQRLEDENDTDDVLQDVFLELVEAYRVFQPFEQVSAWLFRVARNRIIDLFRKKKPVPLGTCRLLSPGMKRCWLSKIYCHRRRRDPKLSSRG